MSFFQRAVTDQSENASSRVASVSMVSIPTRMLSRKGYL